jgi:branched-chain amino acid aminotransferase group I
MKRLHRSAPGSHGDPFSVEELAQGAKTCSPPTSCARLPAPDRVVDDGKRGQRIEQSRARRHRHLAMGRIPRRGGAARGIKAQVSAISRMSMRAFMPKGKICGQYVNSIIAKRAAQAAGFDEAILLDEHGYVAEATGENVFLVDRGHLMTPPTSQPILEGITRDSVIKIAQSLGVTVREERFARDALIASDEIFLCGTAAEVTPVREVDGHALSGGTRGPVTEQIQAAYLKATRGELASFENWLSPYTPAP